jgi:hypothetical protein
VAAMVFVSATALAGSALAASITSFTPTSGLTQTPADGSKCPGAMIAISGLGFVDDGGVTAVSFNGVASQYIQVGSNSTVYAMVPDKATTGPITVTTPAGTATSPTAFKVNPCLSGSDQTTVAAPNPKPSVQTFTPTKAKTGAKVTVTGTGFTGVTAVRIGAVKAQFKVASATKLTLTVPVLTKGGRVSVTTDAGTGFSTTNFTKG